MMTRCLAAHGIGASRRGDDRRSRCAVKVIRSVKSREGAAAHVLVSTRILPTQRGDLEEVTREVRDELSSARYEEDELLLEALETPEKLDQGKPGGGRDLAR